MAQGRQRARSTKKGKLTGKSTAPSTGSVLPADITKVSLQLQQSLLNIFRDALWLASADTDLRQVVQEVKGHLYNRDFAKAFGSQQYLHAYALRWSASRALAYAEIFAGLFDVNAVRPPSGVTFARDDEQQPIHINILCMGGGSGAEVVALAAITRMSSVSQLCAAVVDMADWSELLTRLGAAVTKLPGPSQDGPIDERDTGQPFISPSHFRLDFRRRDILECSEDELRLLVTDTSIVTIMFTMNELFSRSISGTTALLFRLTEFMKTDSWLVIVDSPGSYSEITLGKDGETKRYPMKWLLDHTLLDMVGTDLTGCKKWTKRTAEDSKWFRIDQSLNYPIELENMRYQIHVYQRHSDRPNHVA